MTRLLHDVTCLMLSLQAIMLRHITPADNMPTQQMRYGGWWQRVLQSQGSTKDNMGKRKPLAPFWERDKAGVLRAFLPAAVLPFAAVQPSWLPFQPVGQTRIATNF